MLKDLESRLREKTEQTTSCPTYLIRVPQPLTAIIQQPLRSHAKRQVAGPLTKAVMAKRTGMPQEASLRQTSVQEGYWAKGKLYCG